MESTFVRKDFYLEPPNADASPEEWAEWLKADKRKAAAHKAAHTRSLEHATEQPEWLFGNGETHTVVVNGVHRQGTIVGFSGSAENGDLAVERVCPRALPDALIDLKAATLDLELVRNRRGGSRKGKSARRRKNRRRKQG